MAIYDLTKENLISLKIESETIQKLLTWDNYEIDINLNTYASNITNKIYTEKEYYTRTYNELSKPIFPFHFLTLIPEYFRARLQKHLNKRIALLGKAFIESAEIEAFKTAEISRCDDYIEFQNEKFKNHPDRLETNSTKIGYTAYKRWLLNYDVSIFTLSNNEQLIENDKHIPECSLRELALYHHYLDTKITKDNSHNYLKGTKHTSGSKLKQHFDYYMNPNNRTGGGSERNNKFRLKLFNKVIQMLKQNENLEAINKAENDFNKFNKNI